MSQQRKHRGKPVTKKNQAGKSKRKGMCLQDRPVLEPNAAGIDIGAREIFVAVPPDRDENPVRVFLTFTADLQEMSKWLVSCGVTTVAMESTGVYWTPLYDVLEQHGIKPCLVDARGMKNVPGRRTDWHECQWLQFLHSVGLLRAAFRPDGEVCAVRALMRHRDDLVQMTNQHIQHLHQALTQMNLQIQHVISDITGWTGLAIVGAILGGERDAAALAKLRDPPIKASEETIRKSLEGNWRPEHLFTLKSVASEVPTLSGSDRRLRGRDRETAAGFHASGGPRGATVAAGSEEETARAQEEKHEREDGFRSSHGVLQAVRSRSDTDPRTDDDGFDLVQRSGPGLAIGTRMLRLVQPTRLACILRLGQAMADGSALCLLASVMPGQRHQRRTGALEGNAPSAQPSEPSVSTGRLFFASRPNAAGRLLAPHEE